MKLQARSIKDVITSAKLAEKAKKDEAEFKESVKKMDVQQQHQQDTIYGLISAAPIFILICVIVAIIVVCKYNCFGNDANGVGALPSVSYNSNAS